MNVNMDNRTRERVELGVGYEGHSEMFAFSEENDPKLKLKGMHGLMVKFKVQYK